VTTLISNLAGRDKQGEILGINRSALVELTGSLAGYTLAMQNTSLIAMAGLITIALLILPYLLFSSKNCMWALGTTLCIALGIIAGFNFYTSVVKGRSFRRNFLVMAGISLSVAAISFTGGLLVKNVLGDQPVNSGFLQSQLFGFSHVPEEILQMYAIFICLHIFSLSFHCSSQ